MVHIHPVQCSMFLEKLIPALFLPLRVGLTATIAHCSTASAHYVVASNQPLNHMPAIEQTHILPVFCIFPNSFTVNNKVSAHVCTCKMGSASSPACLPMTKHLSHQPCWPTKSVQTILCKHPMAINSNGHMHNKWNDIPITLSLVNGISKRKFSTQLLHSMLFSAATVQCCISICISELCTSITFATMLYQCARTVCELVCSPRRAMSTSSRCSYFSCIKLGKRLIFVYRCNSWAYWHAAHMRWNVCLCLNIS